MSNVIVGNNLIAAITGGVYYTTALANTIAGNNQLLTSPASILADYIIDTLTTMTTPVDEGAWPLYISHMPDGDSDQVQDNAGAVYDTTGVKDGRLRDGEMIPHYGVQLRIRSLDYETGYVKIEAVATALDELYRATVEMDAGEYLLQNVSRTSPIIALGLEGGTKRRFLFTVNFLMSVKELS